MPAQAAMYTQHRTMPASPAPGAVLVVMNELNARVDTLQASEGRNDALSWTSSGTV
jgi:hypothetical protein